MRYNIRKNWVKSLEILRKHPIILLPFIFGAFFEALALELIYFSTRRPLSLIFGPLIKKFVNEAALYYPANLMSMPQIFYYAQVVMYILVGVFLMGIGINIFKNIKAGLPLKSSAIIRNALKRYPAFLLYGILMILLMYIIKRVDGFLFLKATRFAARYIPQVVTRLSFVSLSLTLFISNMLLQVFLILTVPVMVIEKVNLPKALLRSVYLGFKNFFAVFGLIFVPFLISLPMSIIKSASPQIISRTFPEAVVFVISGGIILALFMDSFIAICVSQFLLDIKAKTKR